MIEQFKDFIGSYVDLSQHDWDEIKMEFQQAVFQKNEVILEEGSICRYFYFFEQGLIRFYCNIDGTDITKAFAHAPYCFTSKISFRNQSPANESIQALEKTIVWKINYQQYRKLEKINTWNVFMRMLLNEIQEYTEKRMLESKIHTAEKNYEILLQRYPPGLIQKLPLKYLASFLGIAPQSLSQIRTKLYKKQKS
ncbi:Crp/Fnr family transcriptional regulator [Roseimarinus sediminis]|uniref:Crp/Fnr family transcriptional regulator n=1 Tax=Roseimarinus sediminis TaxID=1610899 RepID=UPI003D1A9324